MPPSASSPRSDAVMRWLLASAVLAGMALSPGLWGISRGYPLSPVLPFLPVEPSPYGWVWAAALALTVLAYAATGRRSVAGVFLGVTGLAFLTDLNRFQPWLYLYALLLGACAFSSPDARTLWRAALGGVYLASGLLKLNPFFGAQVLPWLLQPFLDATPGTPAMAAAGVAVALLESAVGVLLVFPRTTRAGAVGGILMHVLILLSIGPLGHAWNSVVWPWNLFMIGALVLVALPPQAERSPILPALRRGWGPVIGVACGLLPLLGILGWWHAYPSFSLYTGNIDQASLVIPEDAIGRLPADAEAGLGLPLPHGRSLEPGAWAMADMNVPPYPEARAYLGVLRLLCGQGIGAELYVRRRWTPLRGAGETEMTRCADL